MRGVVDFASVSAAYYHVWLNPGETVTANVSYLGTGGGVLNQYNAYYPLGDQMSATLGQHYTATTSATNSTTAAAQVELKFSGWAVDSLAYTLNVWRAPSVVARSGHDGR